MSLLADQAYVSNLPAAPAPGAPKAARTWTGTRVVGTVLVALWAALAFSVAASFVFGFDAEFVGRYGPRLLQGLWKTLWITALSVTLGALLGAILTAGRLSKRWWANAPATAFMAFFRGTPLIAQVFLIYYGSGEFSDFFKQIGVWWLFRDAIWCAILAFTCNTAAYQAQIYMGAIRNVGKGQREAGQALGLSKATIARKIVLPQALITALRPLGNEVVLMVKGSAIASVITVLDLMGETRLAYSRSFDFDVYLWAAVLYLVVVETLRRVWDAAEERLTRHLKR